MKIGNIFPKNRLKELRKYNNWTQKELAARLGVTERTYRGYEAGKMSIPSDVLLALSDMFGGASTDYILGVSGAAVSDNYGINKRLGH